MLSRLSPYWLWGLLSLPALNIFYAAFTDTNPKILHILVHPSGEFAARFMIIAMLATPLTMLFKGWRGPLWLKKNRRYFGVASFAYAVLHLGFYVADKASLAKMIGELSHLHIWTGWIAFLIFIPLGVTSSDYFLRKLGTRWKPLQRWTYGAAILVLIHWASLREWKHYEPALVHFAPLIALTLYRLWYVYLRKRPTRRA